MLDIKYIRDNADTLKKAIEAKQFNPDIVGEVIRVDTERRDLMEQVQKRRAEINEHAAKLKGGKPSDADIAIGRDLKEKLKEAACLEKLSSFFIC